MRKLKLFNGVAEIPPIFKGSYFHSLDGLRALAISMLIVAHIGMSYKYFDQYFYPIANLGLQFFFTLSGFLITTLLIKEKVITGNISLKRFYIRRFFRIVPVAYLYLFIILMINMLSNINMSYYSILLSFLFLRNFLLNPKGVNNLSTHYWSLAVEEQFYLIFPVILKNNLKFFIIFLIVMISFPVIINIYEIIEGPLKLTSVPAKIFYQFFSQFQSISIGSMSSILIFKKIISDNMFKSRVTLWTIVLLLVIIFLTFFRTSIQSVSNILISLFFVVIMILNLPSSDAASFAVLNNKYVKLTGVLSYSMYIWQQPFTYSLTFIKKLSFFQVFKTTPLIYLLINIGSAIAIFIVSYISYFFYEKQFLKLKKKFNSVSPSL